MTAKEVANQLHKSILVVDQPLVKKYPDLSSFIDIFFNTKMNKFGKRNLIQKIIVQNLDKNDPFKIAYFALQFYTSTTEIPIFEIGKEEPENSATDITIEYKIIGPIFYQYPFDQFAHLSVLISPPKNKQLFILSLFSKEKELFKIGGNPDGKDNCKRWNRI